MHKIKIGLVIFLGAVMLTSCGSNNTSKTINETENVVSVSENTENQQDNSANKTEEIESQKEEEKNEAEQKEIEEQQKLEEEKKEAEAAEQKKLEEEKKAEEAEEQKKAEEVEQQKKAEEQKQAAETVTVNTQLNEMVVSNINYKLENNIIVLDPGHATKADLSKEPIGPGASTTKYKQTGGAYGAFTKTPEYVVNMQVAQKLKGYLEQKGFTVVMTKTENSTVMSNSLRAKVGNDAGAALVIRIHADGSNNQDVKGASMLIPSNNEYCSSIYDESKAYGKFILDAMCSQVGIKNRGLSERADISGFNWSTVPVVLVEMGFMSNKEEDYLLKSDEYQDKIARALANGVEAIGVK